MTATDLTHLPPDEVLTRQFYDWERRGRGWELFPVPVEIEPPFRPFVRFLPPRRVVDDGLRPTFLSSVVDWAKKRLTGERDESERDYLQTEALAERLLTEPLVEPDENEEAIIEYELVLPPAVKTSPDVAARFLSSLSYCRHPISFELIGLPESITLQLACLESDSYPLREQLAAYFPEASLRERKDFLQHAWFGPGEELIVLFGLSNEFMLPVKTFGSFEIDPLIAFAGALSNLQENEAGVLQVLFEPVRHPWAESIFRAVCNAEGKAFFENAPEMVALAKRKIAAPLYAAIFRIAARAQTKDRMWQLARSLGGAFAQFKEMGSNELIPLESDAALDAEHSVDLVLRRSRRTGMILSADELVSIVHPPSASVKVGKLRRRIEKSKAAPKSLLGEGILLGENEHEDVIREVRLPLADRLKHTYVIGVPGTGKSTFLINLIVQDMEAGRGVAVLDPHGDLIDRILERIPKNRIDDVILVNPADADYPVGFNILSAHSEIEKHLLASDLVAVFRRLSTSWGDQMNSVLANAIAAFLESDQGGTLSDLRRFLIEKEFRAEFLKTVKDPEIAYYWKREFPMLTGGKSLGPLLTRLDTFLRPRLIRNMVGQKENRLDFRSIMDQGKILLCKLSQGSIGEENAYLLGSLIVSKFHQIALARQEVEAAERRPFFLYIDEFQNFITPSMGQILSGTRKYGLGLILAHQELRQLGAGSSEIAGAVLANPYTRVCFRLGDDDARKLEGGFSYFEAKDLQNLGTGEALCRVGRAEHDFNLRTPDMPPVEREAAREKVQAILALSRSRYAARREEVESELAKATAIIEEDEPAKERVREKTKRRTETTEEERPEPKPPVAELSKDAAREETSSVESAIKPSEPKAEARAGEVSGLSEPSAPLEAAEPPTYVKAVEQWKARQEAEPEAMPSSPSAKRPIPAAPTLGRGGKDHQYLQGRIKGWAKGMGWNAVIEKPILGGAGSIDVTLEKGSLAIACEISVTTDALQEVANIEKCVKAGFLHVISICENEKRRARIRDAVSERLGGEEFARVRFLKHEDLAAAVQEIEFSAGERESAGGGRRVRRRMAPGRKENNATSEQSAWDAFFGRGRTPPNPPPEI